MEVLGAAPNPSSKDFHHERRREALAGTFGYAVGRRGRRLARPRGNARDGRPQGPTGATGATGPAGADGTTFTPQSPLGLANGVLSIDLSGYAENSDLPPKLWITSSTFTATEGVNSGGTVFKSYFPGLKAGDLVWNTSYDTLDVLTSVTEENETTYRVAYTGRVDLSRIRGIMTTTALDLAPGVTGSGSVSTDGHAVGNGTLLLNTTSGNLMVATSKESSVNGRGWVYARGIANVFNSNVSGGSTYTAASPLSIDANDEISIDLSAYAALAGATFTGAVSGITPTANAHFATKQYVDQAVPSIQASSPLSYSNGTISIDLSSYATRQYVDNAVPSLSGYATESYVQTYVANAIAALDDLSEEEF